MFLWKKYKTIPTNDLHTVFHFPLPKKYYYLLKALFVWPDRKLASKLLKWDVALNKCPDKFKLERMIHTGSEFLLRLTPLYLFAAHAAVCFNKHPTLSPPPTPPFFFVLRKKDTDTIGRRLWQNSGNRSDYSKHYLTAAVSLTECAHCHRGHWCERSTTQLNNIY